MVSREHQQLKAAHEYMRENLPFYISADWNSCYAHPFYDWQKQFLLVGTETIDRKLLAFLTAANQIGKSSIQIIKCINMAVRQDLWHLWFPNKRPTTFIYCYPESKLATVEFEEKWVKEYLPRGEMKNDPRYGWTATFGDKGQIDSITFFSGVTVYFRFYSQAPKSLQGATVDAIFLDEETPEAHYDELMVRTQARQAIGSGHVSMVFTATLGQDYLYKCMECQGTPVETFKNAWKRQISVFDCLFYADGTPSRVWTENYIRNELMPKYRNAREIQRRIYGRFVKSSGLIFEEFDIVRGVEQQGVTDMTGWRSFVGIDFGAGGEYGHSSAIVHVKVDPGYENARIASVWWSQKRRMTQGDLLLRYKMMRSTFGPHWAFGDWGATDLFTLAAREGIPLHKAEKSHEIGINLLNSLFKDEQMKVITGTSPDVAQLVQELKSVSEETPKRHRIDDCADALRYAISLVPFRLKSLKAGQKAVEAKVMEEINPRMAFYRGLDRKDDPMSKFEHELGQELQEVIESFEELI